ncbi:MAG: hypothetical protein KAS02_00850, partial [Candidatus Pacebacteria bacterium]|nr:hypothetical protein [Candidatus Paceibacterota bacterium]
MKQRIGAITLLILLCVGLFTFYIFLNTKEEEIPVLDNSPKYTVIGSSVEERKIEAYTFGKGETHLLFVGGIHGGYEWNSVLLAYEMLDYFKTNTEIIPENISLTIIPSANPDGVFKITKKEGLFTTDNILENTDTTQGRFNANEV